MTFSNSLDPSTALASKPADTNRLPWQQASKVAAARGIGGERNLEFLKHF
jgi:hypothetical protein